MTQYQISHLAYYLWIDRGSPPGGTEMDDWFTAKSMLDKCKYFCKVCGRAVLATRHDPPTFVFSHMRKDAKKTEEWLGTSGAYVECKDCTTTVRPVFAVCPEITKKI
jgi:hypothetical protein